MRLLYQFLHVATWLMLAASYCSAESESGHATTGTLVELTRFDIRMLDSTNYSASAQIPFYVIGGIIRYEPALGDILAGRYSAETSPVAKLLMLAALRKYKHPSAPLLLDEAKASTNRNDRENAELIESGSYSNSFAAFIDDPNILCTRVRVHLRHIDTLAPNLWPETLFMLRYNAEACGYDEKVGDAFVEFYHKHPEEEFYHIRVGILFVLLNQRHPALPTLIARLKQSTKRDDTDLAAYLESKLSVATAPPP